MQDSAITARIDATVFCRRRVLEPAAGYAIMAPTQDLAAAQGFSRGRPAWVPARLSPSRPRTPRMYKGHTSRHCPMSFAILCTAPSGTLTSDNWGVVAALKTGYFIAIVFSALDLMNA